ncbi:heat shock protein STI-like, partial [Trifolium medium]|nr:heat shock protein STI-like [Trifolium medium]
LKPHWSKGYSRLGAAHYGLSQYDNAVWAYKKGLEIDTAIQDYWKALEFDDQDVSFLINRAAVYLDMGK